MEHVYFWLTVGILFLILEMFTATLYGFNLAIGSFLAALYVWVMGTTQMDVWQLLIFGITGLLLSIWSPRLTRRSSNPLKIGIETYIGKNSTLLKNGNIWKVKFDGVEYLVTSSSEKWFSENKEVKVIGVEGTVLKVEEAKD